MDRADNIKIAVFGAGSIGCYVGGYLQSAGGRVAYIGRDRFKQMLKEHGLTLTHYERDAINLPPGSAEFHLQPRHISDADIILVTVKSQDTDEAGKALAWHAREDALVISLQNGVSNAEVLRAIMPDHKVLGGMVPFNVTAAGPGVFHSGTEGELIVQRDTDPRLDKLMKLFTISGLPAKTHDNIDGVMWGKLLVNLNNALNVLHGGTLLTGLYQRDYRRALAASIEEGVAVCRGAGIEPVSFGAAPLETMVKTLRLPNLLYKPLMKKLIKIDETARSSMLDDLELGRPTEINYLQGEIVKLAGGAHNAPVNASILEATHAAFAAGQSPCLTGREIYALTKTPPSSEA